jgi:hypothetical protein
MSFTVPELPLKMRATIAATDTNCIAVALTELPAAFVSFQRILGAFPPHKNVNSADASLVSAVQFSGNHAIFATNAVTTATFSRFLRHEHKTDGTQFC